MIKNRSNNHKNLLKLSEQELEGQFIDISILTQEMLDCFEMYKLDNNNIEFFSLTSEQIKRSLDLMVQIFRKGERKY